MAQFLSVFAAIFGGVALIGGLIESESDRGKDRDVAKVYVQVGLGLLGLAVTLFIAGT